MTDQNIRAKQILIQQLREVAEKETVWLEKNRLLYAEKRLRLDSLVELCGANGGDVTPEEKKLSKHIALNEFRCSAMWDLAKETNPEEQSLKDLESSVTDVCAVITFTIDEQPLRVFKL